MDNVTRKKLTEPYAKENCTLQLPLFYFGKGKPKKTVVNWSDEKGDYVLKSVCDYGVPGSFEQDIYAATMCIWVSQGMPRGGILLNYSDIARVLFLKPKDSVGRIKVSLKKLAQARYEFDQCFISFEKGKPTKVNAHFSLFDSASLFEYKKGEKSKRNSESKLIFPVEIRNNLEAKYYQFLDMAWYRSLPEGLPRRLYEYLAKRIYQHTNGTFVISEEILCRWLPIYDKHSTQRRKRLEKISHDLINAGYLLSYEFDKRKKHCKFKYNLTSKAPEVLRKKNLQDKAKEITQTKSVNSGKIQILHFEAFDWMSGIPNFDKEQRKEIASLPIHKIVELFPIIKNEYDAHQKKGTTPDSSWVYYRFICKEQGEKTASKEKDNYSKINSLLELMKVKQISKKLRGIVVDYVEKKGCHYVEECILYTNHKSRKNYSSYLQQVLINNWAEEWAEEEREKIDKIAKIKEQEHKRMEVEKREEQQKQYAISLQPLFLDKLANIDNLVKLALWDQAEKSVSTEQIGRSMNVKIEYASLVLKYLNTNGEEFPVNIISDLGFVREITDNIGSIK